MFERKARVNFDTTRGIGKEHRVGSHKVDVYVSQIGRATRNLALKIILRLGEGIQLPRVRALVGYDYRGLRGPESDID